MEAEHKKELENLERKIKLDQYAKNDEHDEVKAIWTEKELDYINKQSKHQTDLDDVIYNRQRERLDYTENSKFLNREVRNKNTIIEQQIKVAEDLLSELNEQKRIHNEERSHAHERESGLQKNNQALAQQMARIASLENENKNNTNSQSIMIEKLQREAQEQADEIKRLRGLAIPPPSPPPPPPPPPPVPKKNVEEDHLPQKRNKQKM